MLKVLVALCTLSGCYFYYPEFPTTKRPKVRDGERVGMFAQDNEYNARCDPSKETCTGFNTDKGFTKKDTYETARATYDGRDLTQWELRQLVDPDFDKKIARIRDRKGVCNISLVPSTIAAVATIALPFIAAFAEDLGDKAAPAAWGTFGAMVGGAALSYPLGGFACVKARKEFKALFRGVDETDKEFITSEANRAYVEEMVELSRAFNEKFGKKSGTDSEDGEVPAEESEGSSD